MIAKKAIGLFTAFTVFTLGASLAGTMAWFANAVTISNTKMNGSSEGTYFAYGDGTSGSPYGIRTPRQLYNLAWMQYAGNFNKNSNNVLEKQYYFEIDPTLSEPLDMSGWTLPPIGTETNPFLGNFNGNGKIIKNLTVSNKLGLTKPTSITYNAENQTKIVGFFGVIGKIGDNPSYTYTSSANSVYNVTLDSITVESKTQQTLIGLAGGYVNGNISEIKIDGTSTIDINGMAHTATKYTAKLSDYGLVGFSTKLSSTGTFKQKLSEHYHVGGSSGQGQGSGFGGSIAFADFADRIHNIVKGDGPATTTYYQYTDTSDHNKTKYGYYKYHSKKDASSKLISSISLFRNTGKNSTAGKEYLEQDPSNSTGNLNSTNNGYLVFNMINAKSVSNDYTGSDKVNPIPVPGTVQPLQMDENYEPTNDNTGYVVAGGTSERSGTVQLNSYPRAQIVNSLQGTTRYTEDQLFYGGNIAYNQAVNNITYDSSTFSILTNSSATYSASNYNLIKDDYHVAAGKTPAIKNASYAVKYYGKKDPADTEETTNPVLNLQRYKEVRTALHGKLNGALNIQSIGFTGTAPSSGNTIQAKVKMNGLNTGDTVEYITDFPLVSSSLDFNFKQDGYLSCILGSYSPTSPSAHSVPASFFSIYKITRDASYAITSFNKVESIWSNSDSQSSNKYICSFNANQPSGTSAKLFDTDFIENQPPVTNAVYYFEIPLPAGEYAIGSGNRGCNFLYLDIGANAEKKDEVSSHHITTIKTGNSYPLGVDFIPVTTSGNGGESISISIDASKQGLLVFAITKEVINQQGSRTTVGTINITDASSIAAYSYQGSKYTSGEDPPNGKFKVTGNLPEELVTPASYGTRVLTIQLNTLAGDSYEFRITDTLTNDTGACNTANSVYEMDSGNGFVEIQGENAAAKEKVINDLSDQITVSALRALYVVAVIERNNSAVSPYSITDEFVVTYDEEHCSYTGKTIDVDIALNNTQVHVVSVTADYTFKVDGVNKGTDDYIPANN